MDFEVHDAGTETNVGRFDTDGFIVLPGGAQTYILRDVNYAATVNGPVAITKQAGSVGNFVLNNLDTDGEMQLLSAFNLLHRAEGALTLSAGHLGTDDLIMVSTQDIDIEAASGLITLGDKGQDDGDYTFVLNDASQFSEFQWTDAGTSDVWEHVFGSAQVAPGGLDADGWQIRDDNGNSVELYDDSGVIFSVTMDEGTNDAFLGLSATTGEVILQIDDSSTDRLAMRLRDDGTQDFQFTIDDANPVLGSRVEYFILNPDADLTTLATDNITFSDFGSGTNTGTDAYDIRVTSSGAVIESEGGRSIEVHQAGGQNNDVDQGVVEAINATTTGTITLVANTTGWTNPTDGGVAYAGTAGGEGLVIAVLSIRIDNTNDMYYYIDSSADGTITTSRQRVSHTANVYTTVTLHYYDDDITALEEYQIHATSVTGNDITLDVSDAVITVIQQR